MRYVKHAEQLQRLFTSYVFQYLETKKRRKQISSKTSIKKDKEFTIDDFLRESPDYIYDLYPLDSNSHNWVNRPTKRSYGGKILRWVAAKRM